MKAVLKKIGEGEAPRPWVYPRGDHFVLSDNYFVFACFEMLEIESIHVWHLGIPSVGLPAHGPLVNDIVRSAIVVTREGRPFNA